MAHRPNFGSEGDYPDCKIGTQKFLSPPLRLALYAWVSKRGDQRWTHMWRGYSPRCKPLHFLLISVIVWDTIGDNWHNWWWGISTHCCFFCLQSCSASGMQSEMVEVEVEGNRHFFPLPLWLPMATAAATAASNCISLGSPCDRQLSRRQLEAMGGKVQSPLVLPLAITSDCALLGDGPPSVM